MKLSRNVNPITLVFFCIIWLLLLIASYRFLQKPPACFAIDSLPYTIETSGCFLLRSDLAIKDPQGTAILIRTNNVRLDLGGHRITGPSNPMVSGIGIAGHGVHKVTIENGTISGFLYGVRIEKRKKRSSENVTVRNLFLVENTFRGAMIDGEVTTIENTVVERTGGSHFFPDAFAIGLDLNGPNCLVSKNLIRETYPVGKGESVGISLGSNVQGCVIQNNELLNSRTDKDMRTFGILSRKESMPTIANNKIVGFHQNTQALCLAIQSLPYLIDAPGCYELRGDLRIDDPAAAGILIRSSDVRLDLGGYQIIGPANLRGSGIGIAAEGARNVLIENGTVRGFLYGLRAEPGMNGATTGQFTIRKISFLNNSFRGALINGSDTIVEDVKISNTGGTLLFPDSYAIGLELAGPNCRISRNQIVETYPVGKGRSMAIALTDDTGGCRLQENVLLNSALHREEFKTFGIWTKEKSMNPQLLKNRIEGFTQPSISQSFLTYQAHKVSA